MFRIEVLDDVAVLTATKRIEGRYRVAAREQVDHLLESGHDLAGLLRMRAGAHTEIHVGLGQLQILEEYLGHVLVVMLARMDQQRLHSPPSLELPHQGGRFHEVGTGSDDYRCFQLFPFLFEAWLMRLPYILL